MQSLLWYFYAYAFLGWCSEVAFAAIRKGQFVNRGFLNGPVCPVYGVGLVTVIWILAPVQDQLWLLYLGAVVLTTAIELVTGFAMEQLFHQRWWDYSRVPLNLGGYVCLPFSLIWGVACVAIVRRLHPLVQAGVGLIPPLFGPLLLGLLSATLILDVSVTVAKVIKLDQKLKQIDELAAALRLPSNELGMLVSGSVLAMKAESELTGDFLQQKGEQTLDALHTADDKARAELKARYAEAVHRLGLEDRRLLRAFPRLRSLRHPAALEAVRERLSRIRDSRKNPKDASDSKQ